MLIILSFMKYIINVVPENQRKKIKHLNSFMILFGKEAATGGVL